MTLAIRHFPDKKKPCIVLEEGNQALVLGYLTDIKREKWLRMALMMENASQLAVQVNSLYDLNEIMENEDNERNKPSLQWECRHCGKLIPYMYDFCSECAEKLLGEAPKPFEPQKSDHKCHTCKHYTSGEYDGSCGSYICKEYSNWESEG